MPKLISEELAAAELSEELVRYGAASLPVLDEPSRRALLEESSALPFTDSTGSVGSYSVRQEMSVCRDIPHNSAIRRTAAALDSELTPLLTQHGGPCRNVSGFSFNELVLQRYPAGASGISPHRDGKRFRCVVAILVLGGSGTVAVCKDREGTEPHRLDGRPGRLVLLRAPGFCDLETRPFHFVADVAEERTVLTLRFDSRLNQS